MSDEDFLSGLSSEGLENAIDRVGGYRVYDTGIYEAVIKVAYFTKSSTSISKGVVFAFDLNGEEYRETFWVTSKEGVNYSIDKKDPKLKNPLMGFTMADDISLLATGKPLAQQTVQKKFEEIYDYDARAMVPTEVPVITSLVGKKVYLAIAKKVVDKTKLNQSNNKYEPTGETREENACDKAMHFPSKVTVSEARAKKPSKFYEDWEKQHKGKVRQQAKGAQGQKADSASGMFGGGASGSTAGSSESLFGG